ncbi:glucose-6-phosphate isomerase [candidate division LCP-89 bacterium B3_LCP]|uniref:Glucose-6-phosphate isomerase n=1 Tax=candidate division LCP-89 bacterium B3_LCP TaxID=2012998 RepID=A0A532V524_UNCL8|nr:MAG: glucose-6-phosphate isomerase [candidate division LCP-89 bacterium B3_LCP]
MGTKVSWNFDNLLMGNVGKPLGLTEEAFSGALPQAQRAHEDLMQRRERGDLPFYDLPKRGEIVAEILEYSAEVRRRFTDVVILGIGGSSLGPAALQTALGRNPDNAESGPALHFPDNVDPFEFDALLGILDLENTLFNVVTKSGGTPETVAQYLIVRERLEHKLGDRYREHLVFTTDPQKGQLRQLASEEDIRTFSIDSGVGGRFSILTPVGLLPAALGGLDVKGLCEGAAFAAEEGTNGNISDNPAYRFALSLCLLRDNRGVGTVVMMPYCNRLLGMADWFRQLWAESLGKKIDLAGEEIFWGQTPEKALGATDQHSMVQLYMEGPFDKVICFLEVEDHGVDVVIPRIYPQKPDLNFWGGHTLSELITAEKHATEEALLQAGRPSMTALFPRVDAYSVGHFLMTLEIATVFAGSFLGINPLDQPGVELGKVLTKKRLSG